MPKTPVDTAQSAIKTIAIRPILLTLLAWWWLCSPVLWMWPGTRSMVDSLVSALLLAPVFVWRPALRAMAAALVLIGAAHLGYFFAVGNAPDAYFWFTLRHSDAREALEYASSYRARDAALVLAWLLPAMAAALWLAGRPPLQAQACKSGRWLRAGLLALGLIWPLWAAVSAAKGDSVEAALRKANRLYPLALFEALERQRAASAHVFEVPQPPPPTGGARADLIVVVLGESASAARWSALGYRGADTNAALTPWRAQWHAMPVLASGNNTAQTIPVLLSGQPLARSLTAGWTTYLDAARAAGFRVVTLSNQTTSGTEETLFHNAYRLRSDRYQSLPPGQWDGALTQPLQQALAEAGDHPLLVTLHTYGSHPRVAKRYPPEAAQGADPYDNSIAYSSQLLAQWMQALDQAAQGRRALLFYVSDHGLNLSDCGGQYTHGNARSAYEVPLLLWHNAAFAADQPQWLQRLAAHSAPAPDGLPQYDGRVLAATLSDVLGYAPGDLFGDLSGDLSGRYPSWAAEAAPPAPTLDGQPYVALATGNACNVRPSMGAAVD